MSVKPRDDVEAITVARTHVGNSSAYSSAAWSPRNHAGQSISSYVYREFPGLFFLNSVCSPVDNLYELLYSSLLENPWVAHGN